MFKTHRTDQDTCLRHTTDQDTNFRTLEDATHPDFSEEVSDHIEGRYPGGRCVVLDASEGGPRRPWLSGGVGVCVDEWGGGGGGGGSVRV